MGFGLNMIPILRKGFLVHFLTNYISSVLIRKIKTMLGVSHKGDLKEGTDFKSKKKKKVRPEGTKRGRWFTRTWECKSATTRRHERGCPSAQVHTHCSHWSLHLLPKLLMLLEQPAPPGPRLGQNTPTRLDHSRKQKGTMASLLRTHALPPLLCLPPPWSNWKSVGKILESGACRVHSLQNRPEHRREGMEIRANRRVTSSSLSFAQKWNVF